MTITDLINEVKQSRNKVIPTSYILSRLQSIERDNRDMGEQIDLNQTNRFAGLLQSVKEVNQNRTLSKVD